MENRVIHRIKTISEYHKVMGLPKPEHPLISVIDYSSIQLPCMASMGFIFEFYSILVDRNFNGKMKYGQQSSDFDEGVMFFMSPGQIFEVEPENDEALNRSGYLLLVHPDLLWKTPTAKIIRQYDYFGYMVKEALFLSDKEERTILASWKTWYKNIVTILINSVGR